MAAISIKSMVGKRGHRSHGSYDVAISKSDKAKCLNFSIAKSLLKTLRWYPGDRVDLIYDDEENVCKIKRVTGDTPGWKLSENSAGSKRTVRFAISCRPEIGLDCDGFNVVDVIIEDDAIVFDFFTLKMAGRMSR